MNHLFFEKPILNSPYRYPSQHWELDETGQPTQKIIAARRQAKFVTPIPKPKKRTSKDAQSELDIGHEVSSEEQQYHSAIINSVRAEVDSWRAIPNPKDWGVTPETARLLQHWRHHDFSGQRPFFCQVEAIETAIWLMEVAPNKGKAAQHFLQHLQDANEDANPGVMRLALKLATGAGKTTVMAMLIAWQTINAVRHPSSKKYTRGFLLVAPGLTIKDRLRVLLPNDVDSYYKTRELIPSDMMGEIEKCKIVITNYHAFKLRERIELSKGGRQLLQGRGGSALDTLETEGQMIQRVMPELMGLKNVMVINDEAHHCYQEKPVKLEDLEDLKGDDKKEAEENNEAARLWINGIKAVKRQLGINRVIDLSATPFFLRGSGYVEGTLFPWTMSDFSLMDAIECGIVKLPRVPVADNIPGAEVPIFRHLWDNISKDMPKKDRGKAEVLDPLKLAVELDTALRAYLDALNFSIFETVAPLRIIDQHAKTRWYAARFGGGLPARPKVVAPPVAVAANEVAYVRSLLDAYSEHLKCALPTVIDLEPHEDVKGHFNDARIEFYSAEALRAFSRDHLPPGAFEELQDELHGGIKDEIRGIHPDG
jgi:type III restriction enzyme